MDISLIPHEFQLMLKREVNLAVIYFHVWNTQCQRKLWITRFDDYETNYELNYKELSITLNPTCKEYVCIASNNLSKKLHGNVMNQCQYLIDYSWKVRNHLIVDQDLKINFRTECSVKSIDSYVGYVSCMDNVEHKYVILIFNCNPYVEWRRIFIEPCMFYMNTIIFDCLKRYVGRHNDNYLQNQSVDSNITNLQTTYDRIDQCVTELKLIQDSFEHITSDVN